VTGQIQTVDEEDPRAWDTPSNARASNKSVSLVRIRGSRDTSGTLNVPSSGKCFSTADEAERAGYRASEAR
jgi:hypothetical protein